LMSASPALTPSDHHSSIGTLHGHERKLIRSFLSKQIACHCDRDICRRDAAAISDDCADSLLFR
jgi:hypothetical protein